VKRVVVIVLRFGDTNQRCSTLLPIAISGVCYGWLPGALGRSI